MNGSHEPSPVCDPVAWLARRLCTANVLLLIHHRDLAAARSVITSGAGGYVGGGESYHVHSGQVSYRHGGVSGRVPVARLVAYPADRHNPAVGEQLAGAYRRYVEAATTGGMDRGHDGYAAAVAELDRCARARWGEGPGDQLSLFTTGSTSDGT